MKAILFDLDDTLISTSFRQFKVIVDYFSLKRTQFPITFEKYLDLRKRNRWSNSALLTGIGLAFDSEQLAEFYLSNIESMEYLAMDSLIVDTQLLADIRGFQKIIVSLRNNQVNGKQQLGSLGIDLFFDEVFFLKHDFQTNPKIECLRNLRARFQIEMFIGDSESDYEASLATSIPFAEVNTGIYPSPRLPLYNANDIIRESFLK